MLSGQPAKQDAQKAELYVLFPTCSSFPLSAAMYPPLSPLRNTTAQGLLSFEAVSVKGVSFNRRGEEKKLMSREKG